MKHTAKLSMTIYVAFIVSGSAIAAEIHQAIAVTVLKADLANRTVLASHRQVSTITVIGLSGA